MLLLDRAFQRGGFEEITGLTIVLEVDVSTVSLVPQFGQVFTEKEDESRIFVFLEHTGHVTFCFMVSLPVMLGIMRAPCQKQTLVLSRGCSVGQETTAKSLSRPVSRLTKSFVFWCEMFFAAGNRDAQLFSPLSAAALLRPHRDA
jgi:hypothetical protein